MTKQEESKIFSVTSPLGHYYVVAKTWTECYKKLKFYNRNNKSKEIIKPTNITLLERSYVII